MPLPVNLQWFDDMVLPGESELRLESNVDEVDGDLIYAIDEAPEGTYQTLTDTVMTISTSTGGTYVLETADWRAQFRVSTVRYPAFQDLTPRAAAATWSLYE